MGVKRYKREEGGKDEGQRWEVCEWGRRLVKMLRI